MVHDDISVIGSDPAGQKAAVQAAKLGNKAGITERKEMIGGDCTNTGMVPSTSLREAVRSLAGFRQRGLYVASYRVKPDITMEDVVFSGQPSDCDVPGRHYADAWRLGGVRCRVGLPSKDPLSR